jgi:hypothetical protein
MLYVDWHMLNSFHMSLWFVTYMCLKRWISLTLVIAWLCHMSLDDMVCHNHLLDLNTQITPWSNDLDHFTILHFAFLGLLMMRVRDISISRYPKFRNGVFVEVPVSYFLGLCISPCSLKNMQIFPDPTQVGPRAHIWRSSGNINEIHRWIL